MNVHHCTVMYRQNIFYCFHHFHVSGNRCDFEVIFVKRCCARLLCIARCGRSVGIRNCSNIAGNSGGCLLSSLVLVLVEGPSPTRAVDRKRPPSSDSNSLVKRRLCATGGDGRRDRGGGVGDVSRFNTGDGVSTPCVNNECGRRRGVECNNDDSSERELSSAESSSRCRLIGERN